MRGKRTIPRTCERCGAAFFTWPDQIARGWGRFCSHSCARTGKPSGGPKALPFWERVTIADPAGCWLWLGATDRKGYGWVRQGGKATRAHRVAYALTNGPIPDGLSVCHTCDNPPCCNPAHLFLGTMADNMADMYTKGRGPTGARNGRRTRPDRTARGERTGRAKLSAADVVSIRSRYALGGTSFVKLGAEYGVSHTQIEKVVKRTAWVHIA